MRTIHIRCHTCGSRADVLLGPVEEERLREVGFLTRLCKECRGQTRWEPTAGTTLPTSLVDIDTEEEAAHVPVLAIDDDESILAILDKALSKENYDLDLANSGREAMTLLARGEYAIILSDIRMPAFDGKQLFSFSTSMPDLKDRVIFLTGDTGNLDTMKFLNEVGAPTSASPSTSPRCLRCCGRRWAPSNVMSHDEPETPAAEAETPSPESASPDAPTESPQPHGPGLWMRLRVAWIAFVAGLRGLPVSVDGATSVEQTLARQDLEKQLGELRATAEELQTELARREQELKERSAGLKEVRRELKRAQSAASNTESQLRRQLEKTEERERGLQEKIAQLESTLEQVRAESAQNRLR
jgi:CheY-like chemotaxis protein